MRKICCARAANKDGAISMDWIYGIPLYSFLTDTSEPNEDVCSRQEKRLTKRWCFLQDKFHLTDIRKKFEGDKLRQVNYFTTLSLSTSFTWLRHIFRNLNIKTLIQLDSLTLQAFVYVCPDHDLLELFAWIPPNVCTAWLLFLLSQFRYNVTTTDKV